MVIKEFDVTPSFKLVTRVRTENKEIERFDELSIKVINDQKEYLVFEDFAIEGYQALSNQIKRAINGEVTLSPELFPHGIGYEWSCYFHRLMNEELDDNEEDLTEDYLLGSASRNIRNSTWIYCVDETIYLEISPQYLWEEIEEPEKTTFQTFDYFIENYAPLEIITFSKNEGKKFLLELSDTLKTLAI